MRGSLVSYDPRWGTGLAVQRYEHAEAVDTELVSQPAAVTAPAPLQPQGWYARYGKRSFDVLFSTAFLLFIAPWLFPVMVVAIRVDSPGPAIFRQRRIGLEGRPFDCLKFRTMAHAPSAPFQQAQQNDPRVTRLGRFLRRHNLDELPQFINVLTGDMSVVGPRPHVPALDEIFVARLPGYSDRNRVRPGVTGLAQIRGHRGETRTLREMAQRVRLDLFYVGRFNFLLDVRTILATVRRGIEGDDKAY
jgi:putative colanic acid biosynthesis UDP-glucose lipid carrier transferase